jgi:SAM-dependent methyltransferase
VINPPTDSRLSNSFDAKQYWEARLGAAPSLRDVGYSSLGSRYNAWLYRLRKAVLRRQVTALKLDVSHANVLDIGSGTGFYINLWNELGAASVSGSDLTNAAATHLRQCFPGNNIYELDIGGTLPAGVAGPFDIVSAFDVLFHIVDDVNFTRALRNVAELLRPNGIFCFTDLFLHHGTERSSHFVSRSLPEIQNAVIAAGLQIIDRRPIFMVMNQPLDTRRSLLRLGWRAAMLPARYSETVGALWGALLYPVDLFLTAVCAESPTTEIMFCRKVPQR